VLIAGGGIAGLTLAFWLDRYGHEPVVVERAPGLRTAGYMLDFFGSGYDVAERMGLLPELARIHSPIPRLVSVDAAGRERGAVCGGLRAVYGDLGWVVPGLLERCPRAADAYADAVAQVVLPRWSRGRVVLVGDACQCVSLLAGQGASLAMAGAFVLAEELAAAPGDVAGALARYERRVRPSAEEKQAAGRRFARWFVPDDRLHLAVRDLVTRLAGWPVVSRLLERRFALGGTIKL
jgi:2-polyprenyl-6-methoxyphenol hydroxylase-like FAD-dependent oxidoreductase